MNEENYSWPPTDDQILTIASSALNKSQKKDVSVLVYWDNPTLMIFDPITNVLAKTQYIEKKFTCNERTVYVIIGEED
jgi:hypothetical protein